MKIYLTATGIYADGTKLKPTTATAGFDEGILRLRSEGAECPKSGQIVRIEIVSGDWRLMVPIKPTAVQRGVLFHADITMSWDVSSIGAVGDARPWLRLAEPKP